MKITFPPDDPSECGGWRNSRQYEALPELTPIVTYVVMMWCCAAHIMGMMAGQEGFLAKQDQLGSLVYASPNIDPFWKLITSCFLHDPSNLMHILFNMMLFFTFSTLIERGIGSLYTALFILVTGLVCSSFGLSIEGPGIGMSGIVYAMCGFMWAAWPRWTGFLEKFKGSTVKFLLFWQVICFVLTYTGAYPVGNAAHISGLVLGYLIGSWACKGNKYGKIWMLSSFAFIGISVLIWFWSPWNVYWRRAAENPVQIEMLREQARTSSWY